jgi:protein SCO1/2
MTWPLGHVLLLVAVLAPGAVLGHHVDASGGRLAKIGPAPDFTLTTQDNTELSLAELRGKVVAITFLYTHCTDTCPLLTAKLVAIQNELGSRFGSDVFFLSISVDPERDRPEVLKRYAQALGCDPAGWAFLTGTDAEIREVARRFGVFLEPRAGGDIDHNLLTSLVDRHGTLRVQYMGMQFDPREFLHDLRELLSEETSP